ncbi:MAG: hypothetical protein HY714_00185 [Candidatus Omnitrophica bacterium]|nr:hypothetical protein [Candidatus Omnitrophota bacterium]
MADLRPAALAVLLLLLVPSSGAADERVEAPPFQTTARLEFAGDEALREETLGAFREALAALGDVLLVEREANWDFRVTAVPAGPNGEVTLSAVLLLPFRKEFLRPWMGRLDPDREQALEETLGELYRYHGQWLKTVPRSELAGFARATAADFESRFLKKHREFYAKMLEAGKAVQAGKWNQPAGPSEEG